jgi:hypothetical protein
VKRSTTPIPDPLRKPGPPSSYTPELGLAICRRLAEGESLRSICAGDDVPSRETVRHWLLADAAFRQTYAIARELQADSLAEDALAEALDVAPDPGAVQAARLAFDARRWYAGKVAPKRWGDRVQNEHSGPGGSPVQLQALPAPMVPAEVGDAVRALLAKAEADMGLPAGPGDDARRLRALLTSGEPLSPDLYESLYGAGAKE